MKKVGKDIRAMSASAEGRKKIFENLCKHLSKGFSMDSFEELSYNTIQEYLKIYSSEFKIEELHDSLRKGKLMWETIGYKQATGECLGNSRSWYYNMSNRYGWRDKVDVEQDTKGTLTVNVVNYSKTKDSTT